MSWELCSGLACRDLLSQIYNLAEGQCQKIQLFLIFKVTLFTGRYSADKALGKVK